MALHGGIARLRANYYFRYFVVDMGDGSESTFSIIVDKTTEHDDENTQPKDDDIYIDLYLSLTSSMSESLMTKFTFTIPELNVWSKVLKHRMKKSPLGTYGTAKLFTMKEAKEANCESINIGLNLTIMMESQETKIPPSSLNLNHQESPLHKGGMKLFENGKFCDIKLMCSSSEEKFQISCHRFVLAASSEIFEKIIEREVQVDSSEKVIFLLNLDFDVLGEMVHFMYSGRFDQNLGQEMLIKLLAASDRFKVPMLKRECEVKLCKLLKIQNAVKICQAALDFNAPKLTEISKDYIKPNSSQFLQQKAFIDLIRKYPYLFCNNVLEEIEKAPKLRSKSQCRKRKLTDGPHCSSSKKEKMDDEEEELNLHLWSI